MSEPKAIQTEVVFSSDDLDLLDRALKTSPELRLTVHLIRLLRAHRVTYPISSIDVLKAALPEEGVAALGHRILAPEIDSYFHSAWLPILDEDEAIIKIRMALLRCNMESVPATPKNSDLS